MMAAAVALRTDFSAAALRRLAAATRHAAQSRRLLSLAAVLDGMSRGDAARIGGMDRQTLRDWVHRFNHERTIGKLLKGFGFAHLSPRPVHPEQDPRTIEAFRQTGPQR